MRSYFLAAVNEETRLSTLSLVISGIRKSLVVWTTGPKFR
ncbi:MAG: hypothetical protein RJB58_789 [Pseudomonadota bacterium]|jgi:hypothetical protein